MPSPAAPHATKALIFTLLLVGFLAGFSWAQESNVDPATIDSIIQYATPMPFPDTSKGVVTGDPVEFVFKYDLEDRPPLPQWVAPMETPKGKSASNKEGKAATRITDTESYPYSSVVHIYMKFGEYYAGCSGAFAINNYTILTAGHCLYNTDTESFAEEVYVIPAQDGEDAPFGSKAAYNWATSRAWSNWGDYTQDWGVILVEPFSGNTGTLDTYYDSNDDWYYNHELNTAGYPGAEGYNGEEMWYDHAYIDEMQWGMIRPDFHFGTGDYVCIPGQSGSSIYYDDGAGNYSVVAVLTLASCHGPVLNSSMVNFLETFDCTGCWIQNTCYDDGEINVKNPCQVCDADANSQDWSDNDGATCDDGDFCTGDDFCSGGSCSDHEGDPCSDGETCDEEQDACVEGETDDDDDNDDNDSFCQKVLSMLYDSCDLAISSGNDAVDPQEALDLCEAGNGPWECINECAENEKVEGCSDYAACLQNKCDVETTSGSSGGGDDDDDDSSSCGG